MIIPDSSVLRFEPDVSVPISTVPFSPSFSTIVSPDGVDIAGILDAGIVSWLPILAQSYTSVDRPQPSPPCSSS